MSGRAVSPSISGISMSSTTTSGLARLRSSTASGRCDGGHDVEFRVLVDPAAEEAANDDAVVDHHDPDRIGHQGRRRRMLTDDSDYCCTLDSHCTSKRGRRARQIRPTSWNFASTISRSNGFMMYSLAPARMARRCGHVVLGGAEHHLRLVAAGRCATPQELEAVHHRHVPVEQDRVGHRLVAGLERLLAVFGFR